eukprot:CAMPEP_0119364216 /NCGR_PEP_ID=MMETSP1334-20130426/11134_1 /TAXON_ID=127549 /ORGANISM="Calcidiscus leptoporus, Strain RCC1130" /LENGTH=97 /DNA_ID=CAMNT_0007379855 /DNA_START=276 /DNA_END=569 /DNA_ORIENTATION=+
MMRLAVCAATHSRSPLKRQTILKLGPGVARPARARSVNIRLALAAPSMHAASQATKVAGGIVHDALGKIARGDVSAVGPSLARLTLVGGKGVHGTLY